MTLLLLLAAVATGIVLQLFEELSISVSVIRELDNSCKQQNVAKQQFVPSKRASIVLENN